MSKQQLLTVIPNGIPYLAGIHGVSCQKKGHIAPLWLVSNWDLWFVASGELTMKLQNGEFLKVKKEHFLLLPPLTKVEHLPLRLNLSLWFCHFDFRPVPQGVFPVVQRDCWTRTRDLVAPMVFSKQAAPRVWQAYRDLLKPKPSLHVGERLDTINFSGGPPWQLEIQLIKLVRELVLFARRLNLQPGDGELLDPTLTGDLRIAHLCSTINNNPSFHWEVAHLARNLQMTRQHLSQLFQSSVGQSLKSFIVASRLRHAMSLIQNPNQKGRMTIKEVSAAAGFSSPQVFSREFRKFHGVTPQRIQSEYLKTSQPNFS